MVDNIYSKDLQGVLSLWRRLKQINKYYQMSTMRFP